MNKVTSLLVATLTTAVFAGSAMAATPEQHTTPKAATTQQVHKQHSEKHVKKHNEAKKTAPSKTSTTSNTVSAAK